MQPDPNTSLPSPSVTVVSSSQNSPRRKKTLVFISLVILLLAIPASVFLVIQNRNRLKSDAYVWDGNAGQTKCGITFVSVIEQPTCNEIVPRNQEDRTDPQNRTNTVSSYQATYQIKNNDSVPHTVSYEKNSNYCPDAPYLVWDISHSVTNAGCWESSNSSQNTVTLQPGETHDIVINRTSDSGLSCGSYQTDFAILNVDDNPDPAACQFSSFTLTATSACETGSVCTEVPPTPTSEPQPTTPPAPTDRPIRSDVKCNSDCGATDFCESGLVCDSVSGKCRKESNINDPACGNVTSTNPPAPPAPTATPTPNPVTTAPTTLAQSGTTDYTLIAGFGGIVLLGLAILLVI